ncbi:MAG: NAD(P)-dependent oxidoreductase [Deltaproteobacteria bacterium]|nr:NAD(P)-dependent oxidoreductase [Deltaproteobacteria bacterium]MCL5277227.1 NAD(P)-dependent oxidoreductase [Deltaproteobacteria bacterium]
MEKKVLITGAGGFIGKKLTKAFIEGGFSVRAMDISLEFLKEPAALGAEPVAARLEDRDAVSSAAAGVNTVIAAGAVFDLGAPLAAMRAANVDGVRNLVEASLKHGVEQYIHFSTVGVYGRPAEIPCRPGSPKNPRNNYERTKWEGEQLFWSLVKDKPICATAVRPTLVYGPGSKYGHAMFLSIFELMGLRKKRLPVLASSYKNHHVHVDDVVGVLLSIAKRPDVVRNKIYNIADTLPLGVEGFYKSLLDALQFSYGAQVNIPRLLWNIGISLFTHFPNFIFNRINADIGKKWSWLCTRHSLEPALKPRFDRDWLGYFKGDHIYDTSGLDELGYQFKYPLFKDGVKATVEWYREHRWLA